ncbi:MAG: T9SS type A sorting domain-containing protein [Bacteroidales bacterium]|nr:T9SS type A sorting domain-containing protein [Bacteroidales bacterium]MBN2820247.1 T9SS type A sorting domain-containing protein [Bacteroidales bacterium]
MKHIFTFSTLLFFIAIPAISQHYYNDLFVAQKADSYTIDGVGDETFWSNCEWYNMEYVWIPYGEAMGAGDFSGRVKFAWKDDKLLILAEIEDDVLSDQFTNPQDNYWNDDCFEVFLDEDYSGGWHQTSNNAFAYHCALNEEDVIDSGDETASNVNLKNHIEFDLDTVDNTNYVWELAITIYDDTYRNSSSSNPTVTLSQGKEMGIAVAYCDNDGNNQRDNFIGLIDVASQHYNSAWQDASVFGKLTLDGPGSGIEFTRNNSKEDFLAYINQDKNLVIDSKDNLSGNTQITILDMNGRILKETSIYFENSTTIDIHDINSGVYIVKLKSEDFNSSQMFYKY